MRKLFSVIRWIIGSMICLASFGGFMNGDFGSALIGLIIGLLLIPPVSKLLFTRKKTVNLQNQKMFCRKQTELRRLFQTKALK